MGVQHLTSSTHSDGDWIKGAIKHPGGLHRALHVPEGKKIPEDKLEKAAHSSDEHIKRMADFAKELKGFKK